jgi:hypothetical protein
MSLTIQIHEHDLLTQSKVMGILRGIDILKASVPMGKGEFIPFKVKKR